MPQFWRKLGPSNKNCPPPEPARPQKQESNSRSNSVKPKPCPILFEDEGLFDIDEFESTKERSRLSKTLLEVLQDKGALGYYIQYMESRNAAKYILCWLDVESFKLDVAQWRKVCDNSPVPNFNKVDHDSLSVSTDCDSYTADSNSLCDYSTATMLDERSPRPTSSVTPSSPNGFCDKDSSDISCKSKTEDEKKFIDTALAIFKKYIAREATDSVKCCDQVRNEVIENVCDSEKVLAGNCFEKIQNAVLETMEREYFEAFLGSDYFCKHQIDLLTSGNVVLDDILYNETALFYFMEYLEQENCTSLLEFWIAATNLQQQLRDQKEFFDAIEAQNDAVVLYDKYFSLQAHCPLGFGDKIRFMVEQNICGENGLVLGCFDVPLKLVEQVLDKNYFKSFLASQLFYKYLSELINTVQSSGYAMSIENNKNCTSDCGSERSFSTSSTFLALDMNKTNKKCKKNTDMSIDTRLLSDPDSLWKRQKSHSLSCGRVTALGKFETYLEPEPDHSSFKLKNVVKRFVSLEEDRKKEEMAWQVAEMIVKDITNVTLSQEKS